MKIFYFVLFFFPLIAEAKFIASAGAEASGGFESGSAIKASPMAGVRGEIEYGHAAFPRITLFGSAAYNQGPGRIQYDYTDPDDLNNTQIDHVRTEVGITRFTAGLRIKLIEQEKFHLFGAAGLQFGVLNLNLDRNNFKGKAGPADDFEQNENKNFEGYFAELGGEMKLNETFGVRLAGQISSAEANSFEILGDKYVDMKLATVYVSYVWYIN